MFSVTLSIENIWLIEKRAHAGKLLELETPAQQYTVCIKSGLEHPEGLSPYYLTWQAVAHRLLGGKLIFTDLSVAYHYIYTSPCVFSHCKSLQGHSGSTQPPQNELQNQNQSPRETAGVTVHLLAAYLLHKGCENYKTGSSKQTYSSAESEKLWPFSSWTAGQCEVFKSKGESAEQSQPKVKVFAQDCC